MKTAKRILSVLLAAAVVLSCWVWVSHEQDLSKAANEVLKDHYLFAYFTGTSKEGQTIHLAVSEDGYNYTALRNNEPVIIPSKGVGNVRDPYIWYNEQDNYYYILATDLDFTDGGGTYSNNSQSFIIWRSKDLVNWYDETFIDVSKMAHLIGDTRNMSAVWAPQVLWDGSAYVVYFTLACNATSWFDIVYLKTTDLLDPNAYYEFDYILGNGTGNGTDNGYGVIDADIIHNPGDGKYYLFYKTECNANELGTTNKGTSLKTIHYYVGDTPTGPFTNPGDTKWNNCGFSIFPNYNVSLEGCNSFFDNDGNLIMYVDEFEHTNAAGEAEAYFHIAKSNGNDFTSWSYPDVSLHNINSLSPRHGSVVKITATEYTRLLNNSYNVSSSSFPETETLKDHLVARFFTTGSVKENAVAGQPDLASSTGITMVKDETGEYVAEFDSTNGGWADIDFDSLFLKTNGLNYEDGFTITFNAMLQPNSAVNNENNDRIYEIADVFGSRTGTEHYTHFSPGGGGNGSYLGNYNGPVDSGNDWLNDINRANRDDECFHEYIISYATGNVMVYVDGELVISRNRFTGVKLDDSWYKALGSNSTMRIGRSGWDADPLFKGKIQDLCIYDVSMSYYDAKSVDDEFDLDLGWVEAKTYTGITSAVPTFQNTNADRMNSLPNKSEHFSNILYTSETVKNYDGNNMSNDSAIYHYNGNDFYFALYYPETTVLMLDGINDAIMPVSFGSYCEHPRASKGFLQIYPTAGPGSTADNGGFEISQNWAGWYNNGDYYNCIVEHADGYIGRNSTTSSWSHITDKKNYDCHWGAPLKVNGDKIDFGGSYYKKFNLTWQVNGGVDGSYAADHSANMTSNHAIYVIDFRPVLQLRNTITEDMYNEVVNNTNLCYELRAKYAAAVKDIRTMNPVDFGITGNGALTASKAFAKAIGEAVGTYEGVMAEIAREKAAGTYGHQCTEFEAREATCTKNGLSSGSYCVLCGEIVKKQEVLAPLPHTFTDVTENGVKYKKCTVCGIKIKYQPSEARYENLFSFNGWDNSASKGVFSGTISTDPINGRITIVNQHTTEIYTRGTFDEQNLVATRDFGNYCIPVTGGNTYVVEATSLASSTSGGEVFIFQYNKDGLAFSNIPTVLGLSPGQTAHNEFTVDKNAAYIELRFDCNDAGKSITYSQIGIYAKENFDRFGTTTEDARLGYYPGDSKKLCYPNPADGYVFGGWYTSNGVRIENVNQLNNPTTIVYGKWIAAGYNLVYDSIFSFSDWAKSSCNLLWYGDEKDANGNVTRLVSSEGILADASKGTITITNDADTTYFARTNYWVNSGNVHKMVIKQNTEYIIEYTATSSDGAKPSICAYITGGTAQYPESGAITRYGLGTQYFRIDSGDNNTLTLRFDNVQHGSTVTFSNIAVYEASFEEAAQTIENREYRRYYPIKKMGVGDVFEYTPVRPGYTFDTWMLDANNDFVADTNGDMINVDDTFPIEQNWHLVSTWTENSYSIVYNANGGSGNISTQTPKYTDAVTLASTGFTRDGYSLVGWSLLPDATSAMYQLGQGGVNRLSGEANGTVTLYAVWVQELMNVTYDNLIDFMAWNKIAGNGVVSNVTNTGFTITCNNGAGEATSSSPFFAVTPGKDYMIDIDITGSAWDVYIFFCDANGNWIDFKDGESNRYSNGTSWDHVFTAPNKSEVVKAQIRVDANGSNTAVNFNNIRVYEYDGISEINVDPANAYISAGSKYGTLPTPTKEGFEFLGWYDGDTAVTADSIVRADANDLVQLKSKWRLADTALASDSAAADFDAPISLNALSNDTILNKAASVYGATASVIGVSTDGSTYSTSADGTYGTFTVENGDVVYTPSSVINGIETIYYHAKLNAVDETVVKNQITLAPASNVLYEEDIFGATNASGVEWSTVGTAKNASQSVSDKNDKYGYDASYNVFENYSNGSALKAEVTEKNKRSRIIAFDFTGTGFEIYGACGPTTGVQLITLKNKDTGKMVKSYIVDTYYGDSTYGTLYQVPVVSEDNLDFGNYTVQVIASWLPSMSGALNTNSVETQTVNGMTVNTASVADNAILAEALAEIEMDYILDSEDVNVVWFDEDSILNGGEGVNTVDPDMLSTEAVTSLLNIVDSVRVYNPIEDTYSYYIESEQGAQYYNVMDNLVNGGAIEDGSEDGNFAYISGNDNNEITIDTYDAFGSKDELYLSESTSAVTFTIKDFAKDSGSKVMISFRAAYGTPSAKIGNGSKTITSNTEMYYDITDYVSDNGTVTIQNAATDDGKNSLLAIGYVKVVGQTLAANSFDLMTARTMMMAPSTEVDFNAPSVDDDVVTPDDGTTPGEGETPDDGTTPDEGETPDDGNGDANDDDASECCLIRFFKWLIGLFTKLFDIIKGIFNF